MQDKVSKTPRTLRLNARDNLIVAIDAVAPGVAAQGVTATARILRGHKMAAQRIAKGQPVLKFGQIIGFATEDIAPGAHIHTHNCSFAEFERDYAFAQDAREEVLLPAERARHLRGLPPRQRQGRHAQLHRHPHQRELLGLGRPLHGGGGQSLGHPRPIPQRRRRRLVRARHRLRARRQGRGLRRARAHAMGLRGPSQSRRRARGRPGLRGVPDRAPQEQIRPDRGRQLPDHDHPGHRRHQEDHRGRRRSHRGDAAPRQPGAPRDDLRQRALPRPAVRRLGRLLRHHRQPGARAPRSTTSCATAARRCCRRRRRSTAPSIC